MRNIKKEHGFTLIELIVTLTIAAIMFSVLLAFMGTGIVRSADPVHQVRNLNLSTQNMETISAAYECYLSKCKTSMDEWSEFLALCGANDTKLTNCTICDSNFDSYKVTITNGDQTMISYFFTQ